jgi:hypothetical protein
MADIVAKVTEQMLWNWNLKQSNRGVRTFESMLRVRCENLNQCYALGRSKYFCNSIGTSRTSRDVRLESALGGATAWPLAVRALLDHDRQDDEFLQR